MEENSYVILKGYFYRIEDNKLIFFNYNNNVSLSGKTTKDIIELLPMLDGYHTLNNISLSTKLPKQYILKIMETLYSKGIITFIQNTGEFGKYMNFEMKVFRNLLYRYINSYHNFAIENKNVFLKKIKVIGESKLSNYITNQLNINHYINEHDIPDIIIAIDLFENEDLFRTAEYYATKYNIPYMRVIVNNTNLHVGPIFIPFEGACYYCFLSRLFTNYENPEIFRYYGELHNPIVEDQLASLPGISDLMLGFIKNQITKFFSSYFQSDIVGHEYLYNIESLESILSPVFKVPGCKHCMKLKGESYGRQNSKDS